MAFTFAALSLTSYDDGTTAHTHTWGAWQSNATQHWKECDCGEEYGRANHTGTPCSVCGFITASVNLSLNGVWRYGSDTNYLDITINGSNGVYTHIPNWGAGTVWQSAVDKGYISVGGACIRNLSKTGDLTWTGQWLWPVFNNSAPNVAIRADWFNCTITLNENGQTFQSDVIALNGTNTNTYTRQ
jgi:hypothetical protein